MAFGDENISHNQIILWSILMKTYKLKIEFENLEPDVYFF